MDPSIGNLMEKPMLDDQSFLKVKGLPYLVQYEYVLFIKPEFLLFPQKMGFIVGASERGSDPPVQRGLSLAN